LNANATITAVNQLMRSITFAVIGEVTNFAARTVSFRMADGHGAVSQAVTKTVNIIDVNDAPKIGGLLTDGAVALYPINGSPVQIASQATVTDSDSANFNNGTFTARISGGADVSNRLTLSSAKFTTNGSSLLYNGVAVGVLGANSGIGHTPFTVTFNGNATAQTAQDLIRALRFSAVGSLNTNQRTIAFTLTDGNGGTSNTPVKRVVMV
jgi:predicted heme/steroid binding protein